MNYDHFVGQVQHRAHLGSAGDAVRAIQATFQTLAEKLDRGETKDLASQLPREFAIYFQSNAHGMHMTLDEFFHRVSEKEGVPLPQAVFHARVVMEVLQVAVSVGEIADVRAQLPNDWAPLFEAGSQGKMEARETAGMR